MSYESRIILAKGFDSKMGSGYHSKFLTIDLNSMECDNNGWLELFNTPFKGEIYIENEDEPTTKDKYGNELKFTTIEKLYLWCQRHHNNKDGYVFWRQSVLESILKEIMLSDVRNKLIAIHYGY